MITKTKPYKHQITAYELSHGKSYFALLMEMGTGKSWVVIVDAANEYYKGNIDTLIIIAPNGVHRNWIIDQIPAHLPLDEGQYFSGYWQNQESVKQKKMRENTLLPTKKLKVFAINAEALSGDKGKSKASIFLNYLLKNNKCFVVIDEANEVMKTPQAARTKTILKMAKEHDNKGLVRKRILTGTPVTQGAFDVFAPFKWLSWRILGFTTFTGFKAEFGTFIKRTLPGRKDKRGRDLAFLQLVGYKNVEKLKKAIKPYSYRVLKKDCLDLPDKIYEKRYVDMTKEQARVYKVLRDEFIVELQDMGAIEAQLALTRILRLQQIVGGFVPAEFALGISQVIFESNPKVKEVKAIIENLPKDEGVIIWCRFVAEIQALQNEFKDDCVTYYGERTDDEREEAFLAFQEEGTKRIFIANQQCAGAGLTLTKATVVIYYSNNFSYAHRIQSEDRCHRIGQKNNVTYIDLICPNTVDEKILKALKEKKNMADLITGDEVSTWL